MLSALWLTHTLLACQLPTTFPPHGWTPQDPLPLLLPQAEAPSASAAPMATHKLNRVFMRPRIGGSRGDLKFWAHPLSVLPPEGSPGTAAFSASACPTPPAYPPEPARRAGSARATAPRARRSLAARRLALAALVGRRGRAALAARLPSARGGRLTRPTLSARLGSCRPTAPRRTASPSGRLLDRNAGPTRLGQANRDGLARRSGATPAFANVLHFLADELTSGGGGALSLRHVALGLAGRALSRHEAKLRAPPQRASLPRAFPGLPRAILPEISLDLGCAREEGLH